MPCKRHQEVEMFENNGLQYEQQGCKKENKILAV